jgi:hypothetical protein
MTKFDKFLELPRRFDRWLKKAIGEGNELLYHFVRLLLIAVVFALVVAVVVEIVLAVYRAISIVVSALIVALPYLLAIAVVAGIVALIVYVRRRRAKLSPKSESPGEATTAVVPQKFSPANQEVRPPDNDPSMQRSLLAADQPTRTALQTVLTSLQRFDHRLELVITQVHYTDLFGDNWAVVRQFVESPQGRCVPEVSAALLEIIILYKRAQEARWVPINQDRIHAWWTEAARRRKGLSEIVESTTGGVGAAEKKVGGLDEPQSIPAAPKPGVPPTLDDLLQYYDRMKK